jgi:Na+/proline symporter
MPALADLLLFAVLPLLCVVVAVYFATDQGRAGSPPLPPLAVGSSLAVTAAAYLLLFLPGEAYYLGLKGLVPLLLVWLLLPFLAWNILPGIVGASLGSPLAYLQRRFDERTSLPATVLYLVGRTFLSAVVLATLARMLSTALLGWASPMLVAFVVGLFATGCGAACGKRGGTWLSTGLMVAIGLGVPFGVAVVVQLNGSAEHLWQAGQASQRTWIADPTIDLSRSGSLWNLVPLAASALLALLLGDEATAARLAQLGSAGRVREALVTFFVILSLLVPALLYMGLGMFTFYRDHPEQVRPKWVFNVEPRTRLSLTDPATQSPLLDPATGQPQPSLFHDGVRLDPTSGTPLLPWDEADITAASLPQFIQDGRIYHPNSRQPVTRLADILDASGERVDLRKIAAFSPPDELRPSEMLLHRRATEELWPYFLSTQAPVGMRGLLLAGLFAAALAACDTSAVVGTPALRPLWPLRGAAPQRVLAALASLVVMLLAMLLTFLAPGLLELALFALAASLAPLAGVVLLGLTSRRANPNVALAALVVGVGCAVSLALVISRDRTMSLHAMWSVPLALLATLAAGHLIAIVFGDTRRRSELRGLILGPIPIGAFRPEEASPEIEVPTRSETPSLHRWR